MRNRKRTPLLFAIACLALLGCALGKSQDMPFLEESPLSPAAPPVLTVARSNGQILVSWPLLPTDWVLEQSPGWQTSVPWTRVPLNLYQLGLTSISMSLAPPSGSMFYRLRKPELPIPGLSGNWAFDEGQGSAALDSSGSDNSATLSNVAWTVGRIGTAALAFNGGLAGGGGSRAWVSNTNYRVFPSAGRPFSISCWFRPDTLLNGWSGLIGNDANGTNGWHLALHNSGPGTNELVFASTGIGASLSVTGRTLLLPGQWHELSATYDGVQGVLYLDGSLLASGSGVLVGNDAPIFFGGGIGGYDSFSGAIDEVRTSTSALTAEAVSLTGEWHFDENGGAFATDSSPRGRPGIVSNPSSWSSGKNGSGINLSNSTVSIRNDCSDLLPPTGGSFSLSFWLYPKSIPYGWSGLMSCADGTNTGWSASLYSGSNSAIWLHFSSTNSGGTLDLCAAAPLTQEAWSKLDLTFNGGIATVYLNGRKLQSDSGGIQGNTVPLVVGAVSGMANFNGLIDELKIYKRERGEAEVGPVAKVMWETVMLNSTTNLTLQGFGPTGKPLTYSIVDTISPTNGTVHNEAGSPVVSFTAGANKGPDAFTYTVSDGEFSTPPTIVAMSIVTPHWLSPTGGMTLPLDGSGPAQAWAAGPSEALDAIWKTNNYYDCFFYAPGEYETTGWHSVKRGTANPGCKHAGSGSDGANQTTIKLVNTWEAWGEGVIFAAIVGSAGPEAFEAHDMVLDCNAVNNPKYVQGEPVWITIPLLATARVDSVTLEWNVSPFNGVWLFGSAQEFSICTRVPGTGSYVTNCSNLTSTGRIDTISIGAVTDEIIVQLIRRSTGVDFYSLAEVKVTGGTVSLPSALRPDGGESKLDPSSGGYSILRALDGDENSAWASGAEDQVRIVLPLQSGTAISQVTFFWNCETLDDSLRLGPAAEYEIQARDESTHQYYNVQFVHQPRTVKGVQATPFGTEQTPNVIVTDQLVILLKARELGVDFYSLREISLQNGATAIPFKVPKALNSLPWGNYNVLRVFDGDPATQWTSDTQGMLVAVFVEGGNNLKFSRLKVVGFGTKAARECFPMSIYTAPQPRGFGNVLVEDCVFSDPAPYNSDGLTTLSVVGSAPNLFTNAIVRRCTVTGVKSHFRYSHAFSAVHIENCVVTDCQGAVYFEPAHGAGDNVGPVLIRSNQFLNVDSGAGMVFGPLARFDSMLCMANEVVLNGAEGWGFIACDTCSPGESGSTTNFTILNNIVRYADWSDHPANNAGGLLCSDIHNAVLGNNVIALGTSSALRLRSCPSGFIPPPPVVETCDSDGPIVPPTTGPMHPPCLDFLPLGYRRGWFNNHDLRGGLIKVRYWNAETDGFAAQQQWR